ncbi:MAG TPA: hypothetical protein VER12_14745 [Polyangiaceae bacterium]|nr:hypothetical protein [Polyangiaceae bacterium]
MGAHLVECQLVRIAKLLREPGGYDSWKLNQRPPALGDVGTLVDILHAPGHADRYVVECSGHDGTTIWLDDFDAEELEAV